VQITETRDPLFSTLFAFALFDDSPGRARFYPRGLHHGQTAAGDEKLTTASRLPQLRHRLIHHET
jgi:hypothetical protein